MIKKSSIVLLLVILCVCKCTNAQHYLITQHNDTIHCRITKIEDSIIYLTMLKYDVERETLSDISNTKSVLNKDSICIFQAKVANDVSEIKSKQTKAGNNQGEIQFSVETGYAYTYYGDQITSYEQWKPLIQKHKHGFVLGSEIDYCFPRLFGIGIKYSLCYISTGDIAIVCKAEGYFPPVSTVVNFSDKIWLHYIAPIFLVRIPIKKSLINYKLSAGYIYYNDYVKSKSMYYFGRSYSRNLFGGQFICNYEYWFNQYISIAFNASIFLCPIIKNIYANNEYYVPPFNSFKQRNISRGEITLGMKYSIPTKKSKGEK